MRPQIVVKSSLNWLRDLSSIGRPRYSAGLAERPSRPPGFDMTYRPAEAIFGVSWRAKVPSYVYLACAIIAAAVVFIAERSSTSSPLFQYVVERDVDRVISARTVAILMLIGGVAAVIRAGMRGVRVYADGVESRDVVNLVVPRVRRYRWPQMVCIVLDQRSFVALDLWDGTRAFLPPVDDRRGLEATLEKVAAARAIPVQGGAGLDDVPDPIPNEEA